MLSPTPLKNLEEFTLYETPTPVGFYEIVRNDGIKQFFYTKIVEGKTVFDFFIQKTTEDCEIKLKLWFGTGEDIIRHGGVKTTTLDIFVTNFIAKSHPATPWLLFNLDMLTEA